MSPVWNIDIIGMSDTTDACEGLIQRPIFKAVTGVALLNMLYSIL